MKAILSLFLFATGSHAFAAPETPPKYVGSIAINPCKDAKILADWYSKLGLQTQQMGDGGYYGTFNTSDGPFYFGVHPKAKDAPKKSSASVEIVFRIDDYDRYIADVKLRGLTPKEDKPDPAMGRFAHFTDPDGNTVSLWGK